VTPGSATPLTIAVVYPDLLGTYGDGGNGLVLARRATWRGIDVELLQAHSGGPLPTADLYCVGGGEDGPEVRAAEALRKEGTLGRAVDRGAVVLGVCAGYQLLGNSFPDSTGHPHDGLGLLDVTTRKGSGPRAVGEVMARPVSDAPRLAADRPLPDLTGFENHSAVTIVGPGARAVAEVVRGIGNGDPGRTEGAWSGRVLGTYLHGPVLARNPGLADLLLGWALSTPGETTMLDPLNDVEETALRDDRLTAVGGSVRARLIHRLTGHRS